MCYCHSCTCPVSRTPCDIQTWSLRTPLSSTPQIPLTWLLNVCTWFELVPVFMHLLKFMSVHCFLWSVCVSHHYPLWTKFPSSLGRIQTWPQRECPRTPLHTRDPVPLIIDCLYLFLIIFVFVAHIFKFRLQSVLPILLSLCSHVWSLESWLTAFVFDLALYCTCLPLPDHDSVLRAKLKCTHMWNFSEHSLSYSSTFWALFSPCIVFKWPCSLLSISHTPEILLKCYMNSPGWIHLYMNSFSFEWNIFCIKTPD